MSVRIGIITYGEFTKKIEEIKPYISSEVDLIFKDGIFEVALSNAIKLESENLVDVIISAGSNGEYIREHLNIPYVDVIITGFDLLLAIKEAMKFTDKVGVITYSRRIDYLSQVSGSLKIQVFERIYENKEELNKVLDEFKSNGIKDVIGSSLVCELARNKGMRSYFIYSRDGMMRAISHAIDIANTRNKELEKAEELQAMLEFAYEGIIVTDKDCIINIFNKAAEDITGIKRKDAIGRNVIEVIENTRLDRIIHYNTQELNQIQQIGNKKILTNRVAINLNDRVIGALATFQSIDQVRKAETNIRNNLFGSGFIAKKHFNDIIGESSQIKNTIKEAKTYANSNATILIEAETGTGKEIFAQSIHNESNRRSQPFVAINCAAISPSLLESELFGYEEGAFSGAKKGGKYGVFELANGGTVFLDEIGEIPLEVQTRLLRVLEEKEIFRIGGEKVTNLDIRVIAATNKDLLEMVQENKFREDLYYRLNVLKLKIPPLRERDLDVYILFKYFINQFNIKISKEEIDYIIRKDKFKSYEWPGNIRELRNVTEQISVLYNSYKCIDDLLEFIDLFNRPSYEVINEEIEKIEKALIEADGNKSKAAGILGIGRTTLWRKIKEYDINDNINKK
ncbi:sigma 54-interacting transcriptional regulator [Tissierella praeacuta]|uniref:sigma 54-interacting transcriptional regulator n=1 Tax=Tissierella praeacuta TaxID=43131 RepID=UPI003517C035